MALKPLRIDINNAIQRYHAGERFEELARESGVSPMTFWRRMKTAGCKFRTRPDAIRAIYAKRYGDLSRWVDRYIAGEYLNKLAKESGVSRRRLEQAIIASGHRLRGISEAAYMRFAVMGGRERKALTAKANRAKRGKAALEISLERRARHVQQSLQLTSRADLMMAVWLMQRGVTLTPQKAIGRYNVDIAIDELLVAVEINGRWHYFPSRISGEAQRREYLHSRGWKIIDVVLSSSAQKPWKHVGPGCADRIVELLEALRCNKAAWGEHLVIGGHGEDFTGREAQCNDRSVIRNTHSSPNAR